MIEKKISSLILFGTGFRYLQRKLEGNSVHGSGNVISVLRRFFSNLDEIGLTVTRRAAGRLFDEMEKLKKLPKGTKLEASQARRIEGLVKELRPTLLAEAGGMMAT